MRLSKAWIIASKDFKTFRKKKSIVYTLVGFEIFVAAGLPLILKIAENHSKASVPGPYLLNLLNAFGFWFAIGAANLPTGIASYSIIGEKVQKSLEPLLATPVADGEILLG